MPPPVRVWIRVSFRVETQFPSGAIVLEPFFTFVLLNEVVPDVETTYFVSIEQKKELFTDSTRGFSNHER